MSNIFDSIIKQENNLSDLLFNCLKYEELRKAFTSFLGIEHECEHKDFHRELFLGNNGRCDLAIQNTFVYCIIEIKVYDTNLSDNQPNNYLKHIETIEENKKKQLYFLIPKDYTQKEVLLSEKIKLVFWEDFIELIPDSSNEVIKEFKHYLYKWFHMSLQKINDNELRLLSDRNYSVALTKLMDNIEELADHLNTKYKVSKAKTSYEFGFYIESVEYGQLFYGIWYEFWNNFQYPVVIASKDKRFKEAFNTSILPISNWNCIPVDTSKLSDEKSILETIESYL